MSKILIADPIGTMFPIIADNYENIDKHFEDLTKIIIDFLEDKNHLDLLIRDEQEYSRHIDINKYVTKLCEILNDYRY